MTDNKYQERVDNLSADVFQFVMDALHDSKIQEALFNRLNRSYPDVAKPLKINN